jgi:segregation and condensation protein B
MFWKPKPPASETTNGSNETPFQVVTRSPDPEYDESAPAAMEALSADEAPDALSMDDIEAAYLRALEAAEAVEDWQPPEDIAIPPTVETEIALFPGREEETASQSEPAATQEPASLETSAEPGIEAWQVVEALLFVGGPPMPAKRLLDLLGGRFTQEQLDELLESLSRRYAQQQRPYQLLLVEGGYSLRLREEFEPIRGRVYGHGPKEVKLAQEALEILAIIAYQQPITRQQIEETGRPNVPANLRQLLRRQLISLERQESDAVQVYRTTNRFLELFGLASLSDLPQAVDFDFK